MRFTPEEMAYQTPPRIDFRKGLVLQGMDQWRQFLSFKRGYVKLEPELRTFFGDERRINHALRKAMELIKAAPGATRRRSA